MKKVYKHRSVNAVEGVEERIALYFHNDCQKQCSRYTEDTPKEDLCSFYVKKQGVCVFTKGFWEEMLITTSKERGCLQTLDRKRQQTWLII